MAVEPDQRPLDTAELPLTVAAALRDPPLGTRLSVESDGRPWSVLTWGSAEADPLLLLHGITSAAGGWWRIGPALAAAGFRVMAPDLPGHGLTGDWRGRYRFADSATDVAGLSRTLGLPVDVTVLGHSWGGVIAAWLPGAGLRPNRLVLLDPPTLSMAELEAMVADPSEARYDDVATALAAVRAANPQWSDGDVERKAEAITQYDDVAVRDVLLRNGGFDSGEAGLASWSAAEVETWLVRGEPAYGGLTSDGAVARLTRFIDPARVIMIPHGEHSPHRALPELTTVALLRALGRLSESG